MSDFLNYLTLPFLWAGAVVAVQLLLGALSGGLLIGFLLALASMSPHWFVRLPVQAYIYVLRGTPVLLQLILLYNVLPQFGLRLSPFASALLALMINETAYCAEIIRGGIQSVDRNQRMAAQAFGFTRRAELLHVVIPQALRAILPTLGNEAVGLLKSTALASVVGVNELTMRSQTIVSQNFLFIPVLAASGCMYVVMSGVLAGIQWWLESRFSLDLRARRARRRAQRAPTPRPFDLDALLQVSSTSGTQPVLDVRDLEVSYGGQPVLRSVSIQVRRGEVIALLGRSGSGKSTLLKSIVALSPVTGGEIRVDGRPIGRDELGRRLPARRLPANRAASRVGIVFQHFALFDHMTALENVSSIPVLVRREARVAVRDRAAAALASVGLAGFGHRLPHELSGGQQQRVAIARALAGQPTLLLFDEPTSALDPELVREVNATIRRLAGSGMTMLISTHDVRFAASVADRIVFLQAGVLIEEGPPAILAAPRTSEFAAFLRQESEADDAPLPAFRQA